jgi:hypothetical protein
MGPVRLRWLSLIHAVIAKGFMTWMTCSFGGPRLMPPRRCDCPWGLAGLQLSRGGEVEDGEAERAFVVGERVVHDGVG